MTLDPRRMTRWVRRTGLLMVTTAALLVPATMQFTAPAQAATPVILTATPAVADLSPLDLYTFSLHATLSADGNGLSDQTLTFSAGSTVLCTVTTSASGQATCDALTVTSAVAILLAGHYTVQFAGNSSYAGAEVSEPLIGTARSSALSPCHSGLLCSRRVPPPPPPRLPTGGPGCYSYSRLAGWTSQPCLPQSEALSEGPPPDASGYAPPGIELGSSAGRGPRPTLDASRVYAGANYSGHQFEYDNSVGLFGWSLQNNTNFFVGSNSDTDWVQFVFQNFVSSDRACIWNIDVTVANLTNNALGYFNDGCYAMSSGPVEIWGYALRGTGLLLMMTLNGAGQYQATIAPDRFGLSNGWTATSGGVFGSGGGAHATFPSGWAEWNFLATGDCNLFDGGSFLADGTTLCSQPSLGTSPVEFASHVTGETSNLYSSITPARTIYTGDHEAYMGYWMYAQNSS